MVSLGRVLAVVQARGGSLGFPRKNLQTLAGHPLVTYSIASAMAAASVSRVVVSTDDEEIAEVCRAYGADVPFLRPRELAMADTPDLPVFQHALGWLSSQEGYEPDTIVQLRPTSPLRPRGLIDMAVRLLAGDASADSIRSVTPAGQNPYKMWRRDGSHLKPLLTGEFVEPFNMPRQQLPSVLWQTGHIDVIRRRTIVDQTSLTGRRVAPVEVDPTYCVDIDAPRDLALAEWTLSRGDVSIDRPRRPQEVVRRDWPARVDLIVFDFDGVMTDNRVWVGQDGQESVACHRGDGMGISLLCDAGFEAIVLSTEQNPVVDARCRKLGIVSTQGLANKAAALRTSAASSGVSLTHVIYVGNDANDVECMKLAGFAVAPADAHPAAIDAADLVLQKHGGFGAVRELCDAILRRYGTRHGSRD